MLSVMDQEEATELTIGRRPMSDPKNKPDVPLSAYRPDYRPSDPHPQKSGKKKPQRKYDARKTGRR
jgi:hypothetical protein